MEIPEGLFYTKDHEWVEPVGDGKIRLGITDYAQHELGDVVYVDLRPEGTAVRKGDPVGTVESVKAVSNVYTPVSGVIARTNGELEASPELVNSDCYGKGWMVVIEGAVKADLDLLMDAASYRAHIKKEAK